MRTRKPHPGPQGAQVLCFQVAPFPGSASRIPGGELSPGGKGGGDRHCSHLSAEDVLSQSTVAQTDPRLAMGTALVYHEDMMAARLLWDDLECKIECPERLAVALRGLRQCGLEQRCLHVTAREASEAELGLVHRSEKSTSWDLHPSAPAEAALPCGPLSPSEGAWTQGWRNQ